MPELWLVDLEVAAPALEALERRLPRLTGDDRARALHASDPRERRHRLAAYMALRVVLEGVAGPTARGQHLVRGRAGKPHLPGGDAVFSLSHIDGLALIGVAKAGTVGVDLERSRALRMSQRRRRDILAVAQGLSASPLDDPDEDHALLRAWCRLEAFAKAHGQGLSRVLEEIGLRGGGARPSPADAERAARGFAENAGLYVSDVRMPAGLFAAVAAAEAPASLRPRRFPTDPRGIGRIAAGLD
jgi:4'-phosphopantetheinyl transferase